MKRICRLFSLVCSVLIISALFPVYALDSSFSTSSDGISPQDTGYYTWRVGSVSSLGVVTLSSYPSFHYTTSDPATRTGETYTAEVSYSLGVSVSGDFEVSYKQVSAAVGISIEANMSVSGAQTTDELNQGEYVEVYVTPKFQKLEVNQEYGYQLHGDFYSAGEYKTCYLYVPVTPGISFRYLP